MKTYVRTTIVQAEFMSKDQALRKKGMNIPEDHESESGYFVRYPDDYESWCPKDEFERVAREVSKEEILMINSIDS